jgi:DNA-binding response OmpR family regulator
MVQKSPEILVVDDDEAICGFVSDGLAEEGFRCEIALNAEDALDKLRKQIFEVALLDIRLPGKSGIDLLKSSERLLKTTTIVMMTAVKDFDSAIKVMQLGASDYVVKPFTIKQLIASILLALNNKKIRDSAASVAQGGPDEIKDTASKPNHKINAIAFGVDAQVDYFDFHSQIVTERTIEIAKQLGLPEKDIDKWEESRKTIFSKRDRYIKSITRKVERNPLAQIVLGLSRQVLEYPKLGEQN